METTTTVDKIQWFSSSSTLHALRRKRVHIPNLRSIAHRWERAEDTGEKEASGGGWTSEDGALSCHCSRNGVALSPS
jgi:hypothetical protein